MKVTENKNRIGNLTSSNNYRLINSATRPMTEEEIAARKITHPRSTAKTTEDPNLFGKAGLTYIKEKRFEMKMKRSIDTEVDTKPMLWGKFLEPRVHNLLGTEYEHIFDETIVHPKIKKWSGSPDFKIEKDGKVSVVSDSKCPQPKAFCELVENCTLAMETKNIDHFKNNHEDYYWQLVSNAAILGAEFIEMIVYMPYEHELREIRMEAENFETDEPWKYRFIYESDKSALPYLPDDSEYKNLNVFRFRLPPEDVQLLTKKVKDAIEILLK